MVGRWTYTLETGSQQPTTDRRMVGKIADHLAQQVALGSPHVWIGVEIAHRFLTVKGIIKDREGGSAQQSTYRLR